MGLTHILQWLNFTQLYLTWRRSKKKYKSLDTPLSSADISIFSLKISKVCYIKKYRYRFHFDTWFPVFFYFFWVFEDSFNINGYNFDDLSKNGCSRPSSNRETLKQRLWHHSCCLWHHQQNFITWFILHYRCGHVTKVWLL